MGDCAQSTIRDSSNKPGVALPAFPPNWAVLQNSRCVQRAFPPALISQRAQLFRRIEQLVLGRLKVDLRSDLLTFRFRSIAARSLCLLLDPSQTISSNVRCSRSPLIRRFSALAVVFLAEVRQWSNLLHNVRYEGSRATHDAHVEKPMNMQFWMGMRAAKKSAGLQGLKSTDRRDVIVSAIVGTLLAVLAVVGLLILVTNH